MKSDRPAQPWKWVVLAVAAGIILVATLLVQQHYRHSLDRFERLSHLGKRALETGQPGEALANFKRAAELNPNHPDALFNVALALFQSGQFEQAIRQARLATERDHNHAAAWYIMGLAHLRLGQAEQAVQALTQAHNIDVTVGPVQFQLGLAYEAWGKGEEAINEWQTLVQFEPEHPAAHYRLSLALRRAGRTAEADAALAEHQKVLARQGTQGANPAILEQCKYVLARVPFQAQPPDRQGVRVVFRDVTDSHLEGAPRYGPPLGVIDFAQNGHNHLVAAEGTNGFRLLTNANGLFRPVSPLMPSVPGGRAGQCLVADLNNDGVPDALFLGDQGVRLFRFTTNGAMTDATLFAGLNRLTAVRGALVDLDYRGNLDLITVNPGGQGVRLMRNLGNMYFSESTATSGLPATLPGASQVVIEDWNNDDLQDVLVCAEGRPPQLFLKQRGGPLIPTNGPAAWPAASRVAVGDLNNDLAPDLVLAGQDKVFLAFHGRPQPQTLPVAGMAIAIIRLVDFDNDGWLDLILGGAGVRAWRNLGPAGFKDVTSSLGLAPLAGFAVEDLAAADFDNDGDTDLLLAGRGGLKLLSNEGGNSNLMLKVQLAGRRSNASGLGIRLELASGGLRLARRVQSLPVEIGVGRHSPLEYLNARWFNTSPSYVDVKVDPKTPLQLEELAIQEGSCPYLYAWDGHRVRFVTDILGAAPLGLPVAPGRYVEADTEEIAWIGGPDAFAPRGDHYELRITEELREVLYLDDARLLVVDHPHGTEVHPTSKLRPAKPYPPASLMLLHHRQPLLRATRSDGRDVTGLLQEIDGRMASPVALRAPQLRGHAEPHHYLLDFGRLDTTRPLVLAMTGWLRLGGGMANIAASQFPDLPFPFPVLEAETANGRWHKVPVVVGAPSGKTKTILVELAGALPEGAGRLRLSMGYELHWDRLALFEKADSSLARTVALQPVSAHLRWRGFSETADLPWDQPITPLYDRVRPTTALDLLPSGWCTRYGEVTELVTARDNALVLVNGGDELTLRFPSSAVPPLSAGLRRAFFLHACGWDKDSDFHVRHGTTIAPLPWHGMDDQRYGDEPRPALTNDAWMTRYNTRWVGPRFLARQPSLSGGSPR